MTNTEHEITVTYIDANGKIGSEVVEVKGMYRILATRHIVAQFKAEGRKVIRTEIDGKESFLSRIAD